MRPGPVTSALGAARRDGNALLYLLLDPDNTDAARIAAAVRRAHAAGVDGFLVGGSLSAYADLREALAAARGETDKPVLIFPGGVHHITPGADGILALSLVSGRNPDTLIGQHVIAAPIIRRLGLEAVATAYMLVESGPATSAEFMSGTRPLPRHKPDIAAAHAMAAEMLGFSLIYLEAGSGAAASVPVEMVRAVTSVTDIPVAVGGGIRTPEEAAGKIRAGATLVIVGNHFEDTNRLDELGDFARAVHGAGRGGAA